MAELSKKIILVTGADGFIGKYLCRRLIASGFNIRAAMRGPGSKNADKHDFVYIGNISGSTDWSQALYGVDIVIHLAGCAHIMNDPRGIFLEFLRETNVFGAEHLARMAVNAGVKRFIFISSVKVNGEGRPHPYTEEDIPSPQDVYGVSKWEAENLLTSIVSETGLEMVILRLPLVYGPGVKANFRSLIKLASTGLPLPFKGINNRRSFIYLGNLVDAIITCIVHPLAAGETFLVSDVHDISTPDLIKIIAFAMNKKPLMFFLHPFILKALCKVVGRGEEIEKLTGTLLIDSSKIRNLLGWKPPFTIEEGIKKTLESYKSL